MTLPLKITTVGRSMVMLGGLISLITFDEIDELFVARSVCSTCTARAVLSGTLETSIPLKEKAPPLQEALLVTEPIVKFTF